MDDTGLANVAHFCPNLKKLRLDLCGRMVSDVLTLYASHLRQLTSLELQGPFLVTAETWVSFFENVGARLTAFGLSDTYRFTDECIEALVQHCPEMTRLRLAELGKMQDGWFETIGRLEKLTSLQLVGTEMAKQVFTPEALTSLLAKVGGHLEDLALDDFPLLNDDVILEGILAHCPHLKRLSLRGAELVTPEAMVKLFTEWKTLTPGCGLEYLNLERCTLLDDDVLKAVIFHSGRTLKELNVNSLEIISQVGFERIAGEGEGQDGHALVALEHLNCGFVRSMDDYALQKIIKTCAGLKKVEVYGCSQVTLNDIYFFSFLFFSFLSLYTNR